MSYKNMQNNYEAKSAKAICKKNCTELYAAIVKNNIFVFTDSNQPIGDVISVLLHYEATIQI